MLKASESKRATVRINTSLAEVADRSARQVDDLRRRRNDR
jgi:hypothetical protein